MSQRETSDGANHARPPEPVDVVDGIPDRSAGGAAWKYALILLVFLAWVALLIYILTAGQAGR